MKYFNKAVWNSKNVFFKQSINPVRSTYNLFTVFMLPLNVNWVCQARVSRKNFAFTKTCRYLILSSMTQTREKWDCHVLSRPDFWMVWRCHSILFFYFYLFIYLFIFVCLFRSSVKKGYLDESNFHHCCGNFLEKAILKVTWPQLC